MMSILGKNSRKKNVLGSLKYAMLTKVIMTCFVISRGRPNADAKRNLSVNKTIATKPVLHHKA